MNSQLRTRNGPFPQSARNWAGGTRPGDPAYIRWIQPSDAPELQMFNAELVDEEFSLAAFPRTVLTALRRGLESVAIRLAVKSGYRNENQLTDLVFFVRHPERRGRKLQKGEPGFTALSQEWLDIRNHLVRPALSAKPTPTPSVPTNPDKPKPPKPDMPKPPKVPNVEPRFMLEHQFTKTERLFARKAWKKAVSHVYYTRWFINYMAHQDHTTRVGLWNGKLSFPGNYNDGIPRVWFGNYDDVRFNNVRNAINRVWEKFRKSPWKMKRHDCVIWTSAHVIIAPQIRLCDNFFGDLSANRLPLASMMLVHEMGHHIWIRKPLRQLKDRHVAPIPPCHGPCYGPGKAKMLASDYPMHAVANPDNYAHFIRYYGSHLPGG